MKNEELLELLELLELGFIDTSYIEEGIKFSSFTLKNNDFTIEISGIDNVEIHFLVIGWVTVPNCKTLKDVKQLIKLFLK